MDPGDCYGGGEESRKGFRANNTSINHFPSRKPMLNEWLDRWGLVLNRVPFIPLSFSLIGRERRDGRCCHRLFRFKGRIDKDKERGLTRLVCPALVAMEYTVQ